MSKKTVREALNEGIREEMLRDEDVFVIGCDVGVRGNPFGVTMGLGNEFGFDRVIDAPISEPSFTGMAIGAAATGMRPIVEIMFSDWITLSSDQIINVAAKMRYMFGGKVEMPVVIRIPMGAGGGQAAQHSQCLEAWFNHIPGLKIIAPYEPADCKGLLKSAIRENNPILYFEHKRTYALKGEVPDGEYLVEIGKANIRKEGTDVTIITYSAMVKTCDAAAKKLEEEGISCEVIDLRTLLPLDYETVINSIKKTSRVVVVHEAPVRGGIGSDIVAEINERAFDYLDAPPLRVGSLNIPVPYNLTLEAATLPSVDSVMNAVKKVMSNE
ncbi:pyruvate dehydrogenase [Candidatus Epulonipiscium fishelsonii]|uniref:Pyruvate dehydrogenase n=1 Tax=Candidatus Epulonipiscium fishelsonii TaxID=77094 RepID=A0ACC8XAB3_9FIRM|nr:pyruvate dehydrogenase [Epulopiscium sp. SCG-B11WGA-EpuloA1]ONI47756.1 pyruvate dehydrogenase [Epulopiscium sp. SCG-C06WGA-EpuloA1]